MTNKIGDQEFRSALRKAGWPDRSVTEIIPTDTPLADAARHYLAQTAPDEPPSRMWRFAAWLLKRDARRRKLRRSVISYRMYQIRFDMEKAL